ncbi:hypothetical protein BCY86_03015 [Pajaroellobacter abortibovis]|uniref:Uncharacterized protein n=1 Tax=Pajaroellobacter abortibovis TaxID=1882918 RepID=A0A1L6MW33_9BACT|nr:hypothetical protein BCY86_03015 [Pajaroellobacter abortibovis]
MFFSFLKKSLTISTYMEFNSFESTLSQQEKEWTGPKLVGLLLITLLIALSLIYVASSLNNR